METLESFEKKTTFPSLEIEMQIFESQKVFNEFLWKNSSCQSKMPLFKVSRSLYSTAEFYHLPKRSKDSLSLKLDCYSCLLVQSKVNILNFWKDLVKCQSIAAYIQEYLHLNACRYSFGQSLILIFKMN